MGQVLETDSHLLGIENRRESVVLTTPETATHIFPPSRYHRQHCQNEIAEMLEERAKELFMEGKDEIAQQWRGAAKRTREMTVSVRPKPRSVEVSKTYMIELFRYVIETLDEDPLELNM